MGSCGASSSVPTPCTSSRTGAAPKLCRGEASGASISGLLVVGASSGVVTTTFRLAAMRATVSASLTGDASVVAVDSGESLAPLGDVGAAAAAGSIVTLGAVESRRALRIFFFFLAFFALDLVGDAGASSAPGAIGDCDGSGSAEGSPEEPDGEWGDGVTGEAAADSADNGKSATECRAPALRRFRFFRRVGEALAGVAAAPVAGSDADAAPSAAASLWLDSGRARCGAAPSSATCARRAAFHAALSPGSMAVRARGRGASANVAASTAAVSLLLVPAGGDSGGASSADAAAGAAASAEEETMVGAGSGDAAGAAAGALLALPAAAAWPSLDGEADDGAPSVGVPAWLEGDVGIAATTENDRVRENILATAVVMGAASCLRQCARAQHQQQADGVSQMR